MQPDLPPQVQELVCMIVTSILGYILGRRRKAR